MLYPSDKGTFEALYDWIENGGNTVEGTVDAKPHPFCQDSGAIRQTVQDQMMDKTGTPITKPPYLIRDDEEMMKSRETRAKGTGVQPEDTFPVRNPNEIRPSRKKAKAKHGEEYKPLRMMGRVERERMGVVVEGTMP
ncbi:hypothetical protein OCS_02261 [Ophiocordyceps sinensis CO18]|uniref:Uncharacterized protein n=1 Tax=Ophiocordyceps sinensis (strain Co18 / CGMCC 3.14243) TaxID=911162 RepID=T5AI02_OPHSC|nr:hypothetical protein OCS_02261 [Ophiocordyceps sinensis CO18]